MIQPAVPLLRDHGAGERALLEQCLETDRSYFELAAETRDLRGGVLAWMPGLAHTPAGAVVHRLRSDEIAAMGTDWVGHVEETLRTVGARTARIYCGARGGPADDALRSAGYAERDELVFVGSLSEGGAPVRLCAVDTDERWQAKLRFHETAATFADGHPYTAAEWVALERRKCRQAMHMFLAEAKGEIVGTIGAIWEDGLVRIKNVVVHPAYRRQSIGRSMIGEIARLGRQRGIFQQCTLAVRGEPGELLYLSAGMSCIGAQVEWSKRLERFSA